MSDEPLDILLIDSNTDIISRVLTRSLSKHGYEVHMESYTSQQAGINAVKPAGEQIVFCAVGRADWQSMSPNRVVDCVKSRNPDARVVIFTGSSYTRTDAWEDGADGYLPKPSDTQDIVRAVEKVMKGKFWD